jgi:kynurenine formamidase
MSDHDDGRTNFDAATPDSRLQPTPTRRDVVAGAASLVAVASLVSGGAAEATSGIGFASGAEAQAAGAATPIGPVWWPSRWGPEDQAGASNHITPEKVLDALKLVKTGKIYELGRVYETAMPKFGDRSFALRIPGGPTGGPLGANSIVWHDEFLATEIGQVGTQFDGLGHIGVALKGQDRAEMRFYNGFTVADLADAYGLKKLGIEHVKPILTRGFMLDMVALKGRAMNLGEEITVADIDAAMKRQNVTLDAIKPGDAMFFHTGWGRLWIKDNATFAKGEPGIGMAAGKWCVERQLCVVGADTWGIEVIPNPDANQAFPVHQELITKNGIFLHENMDLSGLAADNVSTFVYVMTPLRIKGGTGSPGRPIAIV